MARRVTLADVSKEVGLGLATVSRALSVEAHPDVSAATRDRIRAVADRLGYRPSVSARALRAGGYHALSVVVPDDGWGWWEPVVRAAFLEAASQGYQVLAHPVAGRTGGVAAAVQSLVNVPTEGVLLFGSANDEDVLDAAQAMRLPVVAIDDVSENVVVPTFAADSRAGARAAVRHLISEGRTRIVYLGTGAHVFFAKERLRGYEEALVDAGLPIDRSLVLASPEGADESSVRNGEMDKFLADGTPFDAVFVEFDLLAAPLLRSLAAAERSVPSDVAIVGFDDERAAQLVSPQLTTVRQPFEDLGRHAVHALLRALRGEQPSPVRELLQPTLVRRASA